MYLDFFGLRELPFELTPNPRFLFLTPRHREALANLRHGISAAKGISLLVGEAGTGKTTLVRAAIEAETNDQVRCLYLNNPSLTRDEFIEFLAHGFGLTAGAGRSKTTLLLELDALLKAQRADRIIRALVVDEAQSLPDYLLEEIRLLANIETDTEKLLPVILAGQPEIAERLNQPSLRQLKQRVALRCELGVLTLEETAAYVAARIQTAGGNAAKVFTRDAVVLVHERSRGVPRTISVLCDNALVSGFALDQRPVGRDVVLEVCRDFDLPGAESAAPAIVAAAPTAAVAVPAAAAPNALPPALAAPRTTPPDNQVHVTVEEPVAAASERRRRFSFFDL
jgi:general secretion pathway protein A